MKHYSTYQSQFIEMFGVDTPVQKISDVCDVRGGSTPSRTNSLFWDKGDVPWFTVEDIYSQGKYIRETKQHITKLATKKCFVYPKDTVVICCTASIGECALAKIEMASNQQFNGMMIKDRNKLDSQFLLYVSSTLKDELLRQAGKTTIHFVSRNKLEEMQIPVPSMDKQQSFVAIMEQADKSKFSSLKSQFIEMFGDQNANDKGWPESLVKDEFKLSMGKTPARNNPECWDNGTNKWVSISDMSSYTRYTGDTSEYITDYAIADSGIKAVPKGTIIMSFKLSIGRTAITSEDIYTNEAIMAFAGFDENKFNIDFLHFLIANKNWLLGAKQAVKGQTLNKESIGNAKIIIPPIETQEEFASFYNQADKSKLIQNNTLLNNKLKFCYCYTPRHISS